MINSHAFQSHHVYDNEDAIIKAGNTPSPVDLTPWQERINRIVGHTVSNKPRLRIVWGQNLDVARQIICGQWRAMYPFYRYMDGEEIRDIGTPRFFVEELHDVSELGAGDNWERARYQRHPQTGIILADVLGPMPLDGYYTDVFMIAHHDELCCGGRETVKTERCLGAFRLPNDSDLQRIRRMHQNRNAATLAQLAPTVEEISKKAAEHSAARDAERHTRVTEAVDDFMKSHAWRFTEHDPTRLSNGKFHWLSGHNKSGTPTKDSTNVSSSSSGTERAA